MFTERKNTGITYLELYQKFKKSKTLLKIKNGLINYSAPFFIFSSSRLIILFALWLMSAHSFDSATLNRWDATNYTSIAENGYQFHGEYKDEGAWIAFFPFYPFLIGIFHEIFNLNYLNSAYVVSFFMGLGSALLLFKVVSNWKNRGTAITAVSLFSFYPYSFFLSAPYTESTFMFLILLSFYFLKKRSLTSYSIIPVSFACMTKVNGSILGLILIWEIWKKTKNLFKTFLVSLMAGIPFFAFLYLQKINYGTPFAFLETQKENWGHSFVYPWVGLISFAKNAVFNFDLRGMWRPELFILLLMITTLILSFKKIPRNIWFFGLGILLLNLCHTFILGMGRYLMLILPFYFYWGWILSKKPLSRQIIIAVSAGWMIFNTVLFALSKNIF